MYIKYQKNTNLLQKNREHDYYQPNVSGEFLSFFNGKIFKKKKKKVATCKFCKKKKINNEKRFNRIKLIQSNKIQKIIGQKVKNFLDKIEC